MKYWYIVLKSTNTAVIKSKSLSEVKRYYDYLMAKGYTDKDIYIDSKVVEYGY